ncbi:MAG: methionine--tRNA ligase subunit beta [Nitrososphaerota archaeon]|nr:methionine--tRNA ligase subunit beta [Nitrososphaerota archaeon]
MTAEPANQPAQSESPTIEVSFDEFKRIDIRTAKVLAVSRVPNSARLLRIIVDVGGQQRQCIAGIGAKYEPDQLKDKTIIVVANMKPRSLMGLISEVMLLAAADGPDLSVLTPDRPLSSGSKVT